MAVSPSASSTQALRGPLPGGWCPRVPSAAVPEDPPALFGGIGVYASGGKASSGLPGYTYVPGGGYTTAAPQGGAP